jgi:hypothetical protein
MTTDFRQFCFSFGTETTVNGVQGFLNRNNDFFPTETLKKMFDGRVHPVPTITHIKPVFSMGCRMSEACEEMARDYHGL